MSSTFVRYGVIGMGRHGRRYIDHLRAGVPGARLAAVTRADVRLGRRQARELETEFENDWRRLIARPDVDAVAIAVPCTLHREIAVAALASGKQVILEKPLAATLEDGRAIRAAVLRSPRPNPLFFAHTLRYSNVVRALRRAQPKIGRLAAMHLDQRLESKPQPWEHRRAEAGGGVILQTGVHLFDLVRHLSGREIAEVACRMDAVFEREIEDRFSAQLRLEDGLVATVEGAKFCRGRTSRIELVGDGGFLLGDLARGTLEFLDDRRRRTLSVGKPVLTVRAVLERATWAFARRGPLEIGIDEGWASLCIAEACYRSAASGRWETVKRR